MKNLLLLSLLAIAPLISITGQSSSEQLVMTGTITDIDAIATSVGGKRTTSFVVQISLQIKNVSQEPYLVLRPNTFFGTRRVEFFTPSGSVGDSSTRETEPICAFRHSNPCPYYTDKHLDYLRRLSWAKTPDIVDFATIEPGGYFEFIDSFTAESGYEFDNTEAIKNIERQEKEFWESYDSLNNSAKNESGRKLYRERGELLFKQKEFKYVGSVSRTKYPSIRVIYHYSAKRYSKAQNIFLTLQERWQSFGKLPLSGDGYILRSGQIINDPSFVP